ncbi:hypothetical protein [Bradyrhizobium sp. LMG 9283]
MKRESSMADITVADARALFGDVRPALAGIDEKMLRMEGLDDGVVP